jgi:hypothetical protein
MRTGFSERGTNFVFSNVMVVTEMLSEVVVPLEAGLALVLPTMGAGVALSICVVGAEMSLHDIEAGERRFTISNWA